MDIIAHGLWTAAATRIANRSKKIERPIKIGWATFWGIFPDLFAFAPLFSYLIVETILGNVNFSRFPEPNSLEPAQGDTAFLLKLTGTLYSISHSLIIFGAVLWIAYLLLKRFPWEMLGWLLHIIIDIPTHSYAFYPTPFLWPLSNVKLDGLSWANPWFMVVNYAAIAIIYVILWRTGKKKA
ncbi:MAG: metal-dependent hydrolase [Minisyncoccia bacterium]|jgi:hypothetical protein